MKKLLLILLCLPIIGFGQNVNIPDANFKAYLVGNSMINTNGDTEIQISEATNCDYIDCYGYGISDLTGIEAFTNLEELMCNYNQLTNLDVSANTSLIGLFCSSNQLTSLDVSNNTSLIDLFCSSNQLTSLDVSNNTSLIDLFCDGNYIECLDISNNLVLTELYCEQNLLEQLNTRNGNFQNMSVDALNNNLSCVEVDNIGYATNNWSFDSFTTLSTNCNYSSTCNTTSSIQELISNKELLKITDLLGRETKGKKNETLLYIYDNGTVEKRITID